MNAVMAPETDEGAMRERLERMIPTMLGGGEKIMDIRLSRFKLSTSYDTYQVTVQLINGDEFKVFLKDFGFSVRPKDSPKQRRERELRVYRDLLTEAEIGTARYYGSLFDESEGRFWLLLEFVDGSPVAYCNIEYWAPAAGGLGRLHGYFAQQGARLRACDFLIRHNADFFWSKAALALRNVSQISSQLADRLANIVDRYAPIVDIMASQPPTLLHGGCRPTNILVKVASDPSRVCIIDWEEAAFGSPLYDVAYLLDGFEPPTLDRLLDAYRQEALAFDISLPPKEDMKYIVNCFRLHMVMNSLSQAALKGYKEKGIVKLLDIGKHLSHVVTMQVQ
jgi:aminoglycoside phosphotransferase (APT) family kinase protein